MGVVIGLSVPVFMLVWYFVYQAETSSTVLIRELFSFLAVFVPMVSLALWQYAAVRLNWFVPVDLGFVMLVTTTLAAMGAIRAVLDEKRSEKDSRSDYLDAA